MRSSEIESIANDVSNMVLNRVLAGEVSITEALTGILKAPIYICAKTLPRDKVHEIIESGEAVALEILSELLDVSITPAALVYGLSLVGREVIENTKK